MTNTFAIIASSFVGAQLKAELLNAVQSLPVYPIFDDKNPNSQTINAKRDDID